MLDESIVPEPTVPEEFVPTPVEPIVSFDVVEGEEGVRPEMEERAARLISVFAAAGLLVPVAEFNWLRPLFVIAVELRSVADPTPERVVVLDPTPERESVFEPTPEREVVELPLVPATVPEEAVPTPVEPTVEFPDPVAPAEALPAPADAPAEPLLLPDPPLPLLSAKAARGAPTMAADINKAMILLVFMIFLLIKRIFFTRPTVYLKNGS